MSSIDVGRTDVRRHRAESPIGLVVHAAPRNRPTNWTHRWNFLTRNGGPRVPSSPFPVDAFRAPPRAGVR